MDAGEYGRMAEAELRMWWYRGLHAVLLDALDRYAPEGPILDAGCGTGGLLHHLERRFPGRALGGIDESELAVALARGRTTVRIDRGSVHGLPTADSSQAAIVLADVLHHRRVDPDRALAEASRCLSPGGVVVVHDPAYRWLTSYHDRRVHGARRFTAPELERALERAGFEVELATYRNTLLLLPMIVRRKLLPAPTGGDVQTPVAPVNALFGAAMALERAVLGRGGRLPFGSSVLCVGRRP